MIKTHYKGCAGEKMRIKFSPKRQNSFLHIFCVRWTEAGDNTDTGSQSLEISSGKIMHSNYRQDMPPWGSGAAWDAANRSLDSLIQRNRMALDSVVILAQKVQARMVSIFSLLDDLCQVTCPWCPDPCCLAARVWIDFKDLLFLPPGSGSILRTCCSFILPDIRFPRNSFCRISRNPAGIGAPEAVRCPGYPDPGSAPGICVRPRR